MLIAEPSCKSGDNQTGNLKTERIIPLPIHYILIFDTLDVNTRRKFKELLVNEARLQEIQPKKYSDVFFKVYSTYDLQNPIDLILRAKTLKLKDRKVLIDTFLNAIEHMASHIYTTEDKSVLETISETFSNAIGDINEHNAVFICSDMIENSGAFVSPIPVPPVNTRQVTGSNEKHKFRFWVDHSVNKEDIQTAIDELENQDSWITKNIVTIINAKQSDKIRIFWRNVGMDKDAIHLFWKTLFEKIKLKNVNTMTGRYDWYDIIAQDLR